MRRIPVLRRRFDGSAVVFFPSGPCRIRPIVATADESMFDGIEVNVVDMSRKVVGVANAVFPIAGLPDTSLAFAACAFDCVRKSSCKAGFQLRHAGRKIVIVIRQAPKHMQMIRHNNGGDCLERPVGDDISPSTSERLDLPDQEIACPVFEADR